MGPILMDFLCHAVNYHIDKDVLEARSSFVGSITYEKEVEGPYNMHEGNPNRREIKSLLITSNKPQLQSQLNINPTTKKT